MTYPPDQRPSWAEGRPVQEVPGMPADFLPQEFLEWALPVLKVAQTPRSPCLPGSWLRGFPQGISAFPGSSPEVHFQEVTRTPASATGPKRV